MQTTTIIYKEIYRGIFVGASEAERLKWVLRVGQIQEHNPDAIGKAKQEWTNEI